MTDQTPSTEDVRVLAALNAYYNVRHYGDTRAIAALDDYHPNNVEAMRAAVRAALNPAHDREVAAKALREAAAVTDAATVKADPDGPPGYVTGFVQGRTSGRSSVSEYLRSRADRIEAGE